MARLIVMRLNLGPGKYEPGDVVIVKPDDWVFGLEEDPAVWVAAGRPLADFPGYFYVINVTNLSVADAQQYLESSNETDPDAPVTRRRIQGLNFSGLPDIETTLTATLSRGQFIGRMHHKP